MRYAFYISGHSGRLTKYLGSVDEQIKRQIVLVLSEYPLEDGINSLLQSNNISVEIINDKELEGDRKSKNRQISDFFMKKLDEYNIDYMISHGAHLLSGELLEKYKYKLINLHPAILPMYPGARAIDQAVEHGNTLLVGNTAHFIDAGMDTGPIIMQSVVPLKAFTDTLDYDEVLDIQLEMLDKLIHVINEGRLCVVDNKAIIRGADYHKHSIFPFV